MAENEESVYGSPEWRKMMSERIVELCKDIPKVGYVNEDGVLVLPDGDYDYDYD